MRAGGLEGVGRQRRCKQRAGSPRLWRMGARAERTINIHVMSVTLDVSRLSGWLKPDASLNM